MPNVTRLYHFALPLDIGPRNTAPFSSASEFCTNVFAHRACKCLGDNAFNFAPEKGSHSGRAKLQNIALRHAALDTANLGVWRNSAACKTAMSFGEYCTQLV